MTVTITRALAAQIHDLVAGDPDREVCGLLIGAPMDDAVPVDGADCRRAPVRIRALVPSPNRSDDPARSFVIDPATHLRAQRLARTGTSDSGDSGSDRVVGFYHSHPSGNTAPSDADQRGARHQPSGQIWIIAAHGRMAAWRLTHDPHPGAFAPATLIVRG